MPRLVLKVTALLLILSHHKTQRSSENYWYFGNVVICLLGGMGLEGYLGVARAEGAQISKVFVSGDLGWSEIEHCPSWGIQDFTQCSSCCVMGHGWLVELLIHLTYKILQPWVTPLPSHTCRAQKPSSGRDGTAHSLQWDQNRKMRFEPPRFLQSQKLLPTNTYILPCIKIIEKSITVYCLPTLGDLTLRAAFFF